MKISFDNKEVSFTFPRFAKRSNPYTEEDCGEYPIFTGVIIPQQGGWEEIGFAQTIDMDYKGKDDQIGEILVHWIGEKEDFIKKCEELEIGVMEYPACIKCGKAIFGTHTWDGGAVCYECEK